VGGGSPVTGFSRFLCSYTPIVGPGSSVGIATDYGLDGPRSNHGDEIFRPSRLALGPTQPPLQWVPGRGGRGVGLTSHPPSSAEGPREEFTLRACVAYKKV